MALPILDGNQSATTLSTILSSGQHIPAHTVVSLGTQAITDMRSAVSGSVISISNLPATQAVTFGQAIVSASNIAGLNNSVGTDAGTPTSTNFIKIGGHQDGSNSVEHIVHVSAGGAMKVDASDSVVTGSVSVLNFPASQAVTFSDASLTNTQLRASAVTVGGTVTVGNSLTISSLPALAAGTAQIGSVTASISGTVPVSGTFFQGTQPVSLTTLPSLVAGTAQIGSVTASISGTVPISISSVTVGNSVTIASLPEISGTVTANTFAVQGTAVTTSNFTSTTASTVLANYNATREVLTIFNEGAGNLHICAGATCTTIAYQVRLSSGDYYEVPNHQTTITHSAVFATAGTARVCQVS